MIDLICLPKASKLFHAPKQLARGTARQWSDDCTVELDDNLWIQIAVDE